MAANPNPARISAEMWRFWEEFKKIEPTVLLGGIYANKPGYHNQRNALSWSDYSCQLHLDRLGPGDKAAAIDLTFPDAQGGDYKTIKKYSARLLASGKDPSDDRGNFIREFYGQADTDSSVEGWDFQYVRPASSDSSHLWHIHISFMRGYVNVREAFDAILSILKGESYATWKARKSVPVLSTNVPTTGMFLVKEPSRAEVYVSVARKYLKHVPNMAALAQVQEALVALNYPDEIFLVADGTLSTYGEII